MKLKIDEMMKSLGKRHTCGEAWHRGDYCILNRISECLNEAAFRIRMNRHGKSWYTYISRVPDYILDLEGLWCAPGVKKPKVATDDWPGIAEDLLQGISQLGQAKFLADSKVSVRDADESIRTSRTAEESS